jgi:hypothetical protein
LIPVPEAAAALWLTFEPPAAPPGTPVVARTAGEGAFAARLRNSSYNAYLAPEAAGDSIASAADGRLLPVGKLVVDANGNGALRFPVPEAPPGRYVAVIHCEACAAYSTGRTMVAGGAFEIQAPPGRAVVDGWWPFVIPLAVLGVLLAWARSKRGGR